MVIHINSFTFCGIEVRDVDIQVQLSKGIPSFSIVGLPDKTIGESRDRVKAALFSIGLALPLQKILINLAPADLLKEGSHFDLAIACGILASLDVIAEDQIREYVVIGELSLDGCILPVAGALPAAIGANSRNIGIICPEANGAEAAWSGNKKIIAPKNLLSLINHFKGTQVIPSPIPKITEDTTYDNRNKISLSDVIGQETAKRAIEVAAAGGHHLLMSGPPGAGKSMLAQRMSNILPEMSAEEMLECSMIASVAGLISNGELTKVRPFRAPHHSCSMPAMVGGGIGKRIKPGEISLAHNGVLFLDELPEFTTGVIDSLRQPIETGEVLISRIGSNIKFPANFQLLAAMNPCKCGYLSDPRRACSRAPRCAQDYQMKISGPILDRFDINIQVSAIKPGINNYNIEESHKSDNTANRIKHARELQLKRYENYGIRINSRAEGRILAEYAAPDPEGQNMLDEAANKFKFSMRAYNKILKVARTIADLANEAKVNKWHIAEALNYRQLDYLVHF